MSPSGPSPPTKGITRQDVFSALGALGAVLTLVTAVMFYFGWRRSEEQSRDMSIDVSLFGFSAQDYVLRSISSLYLPLLVIFGAGLAWLWLHARLVRLLRSDLLASAPRRSVAMASLGVLAVVCVMLSASCVLFLALIGTPLPPAPVRWVALKLREDEWVVPFVLVVATLTAAYAAWIRRQLHPAPVDTSAPLWQALLPVVLVTGTVALGSFWLLDEYAATVGHSYAQQLAGDVHKLAITVVISPTPLGIDAPGVREERLGELDSPGVRYRTTGLRLLARSGGKVLLVHDGWDIASGTVIVLPDSEELGWQFSSDPVAARSRDVAGGSSGSWRPGTDFLTDHTRGADAGRREEHHFAGRLVGMARVDLAALADDDRAVVVAIPEAALGQRAHLVGG